ncbi:MAG: lamin tail domain-containing protein [Chloroflexota bacterium]
MRLTYRFFLFSFLAGLSLLLWQPILAQAQVTPPSFSVARGFFDAPFDVVLTAETSATIYYTTDGSTPTKTSATPYTTPITINTTTPLRAIAARDGLLDSEVVTHTYFFLDDVLTQGNSPVGYPDEWAADDGFGPYPSDYEMDPEVVNDPAYSGLLHDALTDIPTLSIVTDIPNMFDPDIGIHYNSRESGREWERPSSVELIYPDGTTAFQVDAGIRAHGKGSRIPRVSPKKSFRLYFRSDYGPSKLEFPLFGEETAVVEFDKLVLRAGSNNKWTHWSTHQRPIALYMRDQFARDSQRAMGHVAPHGVYVHLYINGLYWGMYNIAERIDDNFVADYFGGDVTDWDVIKPHDDGGQEAAEGNLLAWETMFALAQEDLTIDANYQTLIEYVDLVNFIDYMILIHYVENTDWPIRNWYAARNRVSGGGFKFFAWDSELALKDEERDITAQNLAGTPADLFHRLLVNDDFQSLYADRIYEHLYNDGALAASETTPRFIGLTDTVYEPIVAESARWGDYRRDVYQRPDKGDQSPYELYTRDEHWVAQRDKMLDEYFPVRAANTVTNYVNFGLYPALEPPSFSQAGGEITSGTVLEINNDINSGQGTIYYTVDGSDPRESGGAISNKANNGADFVNVSLFNTVTVKARVKDGDVWSAVQEATYFVAQDLSQLVINEIMYHPPNDAGLDGDEYEFIELVNKGAAELNLDGVAFVQGINYTFGAGTAVSSGQYIVLASNPTAFEAKYGFAPDGVYTDRLANGGESLLLQDGLGSVIDQVIYDDVAPWSIDPDGFGSSLELSDPHLDNALAASWKASSEAGGTPKAQNSTGTTDPCFGVNPAPIVINEINYNSSDGFNPEDWVEIYNPTGTAVDVSGWVFQDEGSSFTIPNGTTLATNGFLVIVREPALFAASYPAIDFIGPLGFGFSGGGERVRLLNPTGCIVDQVAYDDVAPWPTGPDGNGPTLTLRNPALDNELAASWVASEMTGGTPGAANFPDQNAAPTVILTSPTNGATFALGIPIHLAAAATDSDGSIASVDFYVNDQLVAGCSDSAAPYECTWQPTESGSYSVKAIATDDDGATGEGTAVTITVEVDF